MTKIFNEYNLPGKVTQISIEQVPPKKDIAVMISGKKMAITLGTPRKIKVKAK